VEVQKNLILRKRNALTRSVGDASNVQAIVSVVFPWDTTGDTNANFQPADPKAGSCKNVDIKWKCNVFSNAMARRMLCAIIARGEKATSDITRVLDEVDPLVKRIASDSTDVDADGVACLCDWLATSKFLRQLIDPINMMGDDVDLDGFNPSSSARGSMISVVLEAVKESPFFGKRYISLSKVVNGIKDFGPAYDQHRSGLQAASESDRLVAIESALNDIPSMQASLVPELMKPLERDLAMAISSAVTEAGAKHSSHTLLLPNVQRMQKTLAAASDVFPFEPQIPEWMSTISSILVDVQRGSTLEDFKARVSEVVKETTSETVAALDAQLSKSLGLTIERQEDVDLVTSAVAMIENLVTTMLPASIAEWMPAQSHLVQAHLDTLASLLKCDLVGDAHHKSKQASEKLLACFRSLLDLFSAYGEASEKLGQGEVVLVDVEGMKKLHRYIVAADKAFGAADGAQQPVIELFEVGSGVAKTLLQSSLKALQESNYQGVKEAEQYVETWKGGVENGDWEEGFVKKDWKSVRQRLDETLCKMEDPVRLKKNIDILAKAPSHVV